MPSAATVRFSPKPLDLLDDRVEQIGKSNPGHKRQQDFAQKHDHDNDRQCHKPKHRRSRRVHELSLIGVRRILPIGLRCKL